VILISVANKSHVFFLDIERYSDRYKEKHQDDSTINWKPGIAILAYHVRGGSRILFRGGAGGASQPRGGVQPSESKKNTSK
jgi:hypothetical protein